MKLKKHIFVGLITLTMLCPVFAAKKKPAAVPAAPAVDPAMAQAMKYGTPGENHRLLESFAGKWTFTVKHFMAPGKPPMESKGTSDNSWVLGGRFLQQEVHGEFGGMSFEGLGFIGYSNMAEQYESIWMDSMSTSITKSAGAYDATTKTINESGTMACPMSGEKAMWMRTELKLIDKDTVVYNSYMKNPAGAEVLAMEITYKRAL